MPIDTSLNTDFSGPELCDFLSRDYSAETYTDEIMATEQWTAVGYQKVRSRLGLGPIKGIHSAPKM